MGYNGLCGESSRIMSHPSILWYTLLMKIETYTKTIDVDTYVAEYVNVEEFLEYCKACGNYNRKWCCPAFDFSPVADYWNRYRTLKVVGKKMILTAADKENWEALLAQTKAELADALYAEEAKTPGSISLSAGSCTLCGEDNCTKKSGETCRFPDKMRYSIEALGGNVGLTASKLLGVRLQWMEEDKVPDYFVLVGGLLY